jgi:hypothetical protein
MNKFPIFISFMLFFSIASVAQVAINGIASAADPSAGLDVNFVDKGFLPPRVALTAINAATPVTAPAVGLLVYNTAVAGTSPNDVKAGYYCWDGTKWIRVSAPQGNNIGDMRFWNGTQWVIIPAGTNGQVMIFSNGVPVWAPLCTIAPTAPTAGTHVPSLTQVIWNWNTVSGAIGYKWNTTNDYYGATDVATATTKTETGLNCNTAYTRYAWAYNSCGNSASVSLTQSTTAIPPATPAAGIHVASQTQILWKWNTVADATGYKWNTTNDYAGATDMGTATTKTESGLNCNTVYTRYAWAYGTCGNSTALAMNQLTVSCPLTCGSTFTINHAAGAAAPVAKTVTYGTAANIPGEINKCWITSNLGADHQATSVTDATEASAGWYWQFNRKQGFKHDGTTRTPGITWISSISESSDWILANDPCASELGTGWRIPTLTEWTNVDASGNWTSYSGSWGSALKIHAAGSLGNSDGSLSSRGSYGDYWSNTQNSAGNGWFLFISSNLSAMYGNSKAYGFCVRCVRDF